MKNIIILALCAALAALAFTACAKKPEAETGMVNPMVEVEGSDAFTELGLKLTAPEGAEDVKYFVIDKTLAQISFTLDGKKFVYRSAKIDGDISGVYSEFKSEKLIVTAESGDDKTEITVQTTGGNSARRALWSRGELRYSLYGEGTFTDDEISPIVKAMAETDY